MTARRCDVDDVGSLTRDALMLCDVFVVAVVFVVAAVVVVAVVVRASRAALRVAHAPRGRSRRRCRSRVCRRVERAE